MQEKNKPKDPFKSRLRERLTPRWSLNVSLKLIVYVCIFVVAVFTFHYLLFRTPQRYPLVSFQQRAGEYALPNRYEYGVDSYIPTGAHEVSYQEQCPDAAGSMSVGGKTSDWWMYLPEYGGFVNEVNTRITNNNQPILAPYIPIRHGSCV